jgi:acyl carrier protein
MLEQLQEIIRQFTGDANLVLTGSTVLRTDLGLNSYELVELVCKVEDAFDAEIPDRAIGNLKTVQHVLDYIAANA